MRGKYIVAIIVIIALVVLGWVLVTSGGTDSTDSDNNAQQRTPMNVGHINLANDLPAFVAQDKGFFADENLEVTLKKFDSSKLATDAIYNRDIDASAGSSTVPLLAAESTQPGKAKIYALGYTGNTETTTLGAFVVKQDSEIQDEAGLAGKKIAVFPGGTAKVLLERYLRENNIETANIQWVEQTPNLWVPSLQNGAVDAVFAYEPTLTIFKQDESNPVRVFGYGALEFEIDPLYLGGSTLNADFLKENPEAAKAYIRAYYRGIDYIIENEAEARQILARYTGIQESVTDEMNLYPNHKLTDIQRDKFQQLADVLFEEKNLTAEVDTANMYIDESFTQ